MKQKRTVLSNPKLSKETTSKAKRAVKTRVTRKMTKQEILKEHNSELLAKHLKLTETNVTNHWIDNDGNKYILTRLGFKVG